MAPRENSNDLFPLTPALSRRERENHPQSVGYAGAVRILDSRASLLPLPMGEGRGEGEQGVCAPLNRGLLTSFNAKG